MTHRPRLHTAVLAVSEAACCHRVAADTRAMTPVNYPTKYPTTQFHSKVVGASRLLSSADGAAKLCDKLAGQAAVSTVAQDTKAGVRLQGIFFQ